MKLTRVTITGADDAVPVEALVAMALEFPFVEWGVLHSKMREGTRRYPGPPWRYAFYQAMGRKIGWYRWPEGRIALHLCGHESRQALSGMLDAACDTRDIARYQLNGFSRYRLPMLGIALGLTSRGFVLQCSDLRALRHAADLAYREPNIAALFDPSGGQGIPGDLDGWPDPLPGLPMGYAGGIGPENIEGILETLCAKPFDVPFWVDMESGIRTDDRFDLDKVRRVLELAAPFVAGGEQ